MNPATYLRVNGPEPWNVVYTEPSIRPDDSRYGENPNRLQRHTQMQVILKPEPGNPQELYLGSLRALGIDTHANDVRFVEDNWESPVLGAWGLGWEVWLNGMEITQFTYFQQAGGRPLPIPAVEITYGLERILMALQGVSHFKDIRYTDSITYGEMFMQNECEMGRYNLDLADVETQRKRFDLYNAEAKRLLEQRLPIPAYDHLLKLSHVFNIMDARGAVGVTERQACFATLRSLARQITGLYMERRQELEHPLGVVPPAPQAPPLTADAGAPPAGPADFVLEVGCEELPPQDIRTAMDQLRARVPELLQKLRLSHNGISVEGTPRRLAVLVSGLAARQEDAENRMRGPPAKVAFGDGGAPSKALEGFCKKNGVSPADVTVEADEKGTEYVWAVVRETGRSAAEVLTEELPAVLAAIRFKGSMRWRGDTAFSRPLRWLLALHGDAVLPFEFAGLRAGRATHGLRSATATSIEVADAVHYLDTLHQQRIALGQAERSGAIWDAVSAAASSVGGHVPDSFQADLLEEVTNLVESPTVILGSFDPAFLSLPRELLVMVMRKHQRYFPVYGSGDELQPVFVTVANGPIDKDLVRTGNESVLRARFEDAQFFFQEDLKRPLSDFRPQLAGITFHNSLGTMLDKSNRVEQLVTGVAEAAGLTDAASTAQQAAQLAHADLATATVMEMTALAGTMGQHLAAASGASPEVALAVYESVLPRNAGDATPSSPAGILVSITDRIDSLVGLIAAGNAPTATADPFGLRRLANGLLQTLLASQTQLHLPTAIAAAADVQPVDAPAEIQQQVLEFVERRLEVLLTDGGAQPEVVRAVLRQRASNPALAAASVRELQDAQLRGRLDRVMASVARAVRIGRGQKVDASSAVRPELFQQDEERSLHDAQQAAAVKVDRSGTVATFLDAAETLVAPIDAFFDKVFVMTEELDVRANRQALLRDVAALADGVLDFSELPGF